MAFEVHTPWPSSVWAMRIMTVSSGAITIQALISGVAGRDTSGTGGRRRLRVRLLRHPEAEHEGALRGGHRGQEFAAGDVGAHVLHPIGGQVNGLPHPVIGAAAARVGDAGVDVGVGGRGRSRRSASALMIIPDWQ